MSAFKAGNYLQASSRPRLQGFSSLATPAYRRSYINNHWDHFEPRLGLCMGSARTGKESVRASYTFGFSQPIVYMEDRYENNAPYGDAITINPPAGTFSNPYTGYPGGNPFPQPYPPSKTGAFFPTAASYFLFPVTMKPSYEQIWNLSLEKQLGASWVVTLAYSSAIM